MERQEKVLAHVPVGLPGLRLTSHVITEKLARLPFNDLLDAEHALGSRRPKGRSLYQVVSRREEWVGLLLWTGATWHLKARDLCLGCPNRSTPRNFGSKPCIR